MKKTLLLALVAVFISAISITAQQKPTTNCNDTCKKECCEKKPECCKKTEASTSCCKSKTNSENCKNNPSQCKDTKSKTSK